MYDAFDQTPREYSVGRFSDATFGSHQKTEIRLPGDNRINRKIGEFLVRGEQEDDVAAVSAVLNWELNAIRVKPPKPIFWA